MRNFSGPPLLDWIRKDTLWTKDTKVFLGIQSECGKLRTRKTSNTDTFYAASGLHLHVNYITKSRNKVNTNFCWLEQILRVQWGQKTRKKLHFEIIWDNVLLPIFPSFNQMFIQYMLFTVVEILNSKVLLRRVFFLKSIIRYHK